jgi:hypothetical protein
MNRAAITESTVEIVIAPAILCLGQCCRMVQGNLRPAWPCFFLYWMGAGQLRIDTWEPLWKSLFAVTPGALV